MMRPQHVSIVEFDTATGALTRRLQFGSDGRLHFAAVQPIRIRRVAEIEAERLTASDGVARVVVAEGFRPPNIPDCGINFPIVTATDLNGIVGTAVYETRGTKR